MYDYLVVGAGLYGAVFAHEAKKSGKKVLVIDRRNHVAGNVYTEKCAGIHIHKYGAHIFHTNHKKVWEYVSQFAEFNRFTNSPVANYHGELYSLPFNMYTFNKMWGVRVDYLEHKREYDAVAKKIVYTGPIDGYFEYRFGALEYRSVRFDTEVLELELEQKHQVLLLFDRDRCEVI